MGDHVPAREREEILLSCARNEFCQAERRLAGRVRRASPRAPIRKAWRKALRHLGNSAPLRRRTSEQPRPALRSPYMSNEQREGRTRNAARVTARLR